MRKISGSQQSQVAEILRDEVVLEWLIYKFNNFTVPSRYLFQLFAKILFFIVSICSKNHSCIIISGIIYRNNQRPRITETSLLPFSKRYLPTTSLQYPTKQGSKAMEAPPSFFSSARLLFINYMLLVEKAHPTARSYHCCRGR